MDAVTRKECKRSWRAALVAGAVGYAVGYLLNSPTVSYILFFILGYLGYNLRQVWQVSKQVVPTAYRLTMDLIIEFFGEKPLYIVSALLTIYFSMVLYGAIVFNGFPRELFIDPWKNPAVLIYWLVTDFNLYGGEYTGIVFIARLMIYLFATLVFQLLTAAVFYFLTSFYYKIKEYLTDHPSYFFDLWLSVKQKGEMIGSFFVHARNYLWFVFVPFALVIFIVKALVGILIGINSARRISTGLSGLAAGFVYLKFVPFTIGLPIAATALGCGLACGAFGLLVAYLLDGEKVMSWLKSAWRKPVSESLAWAKP